MGPKANVVVVFLFALAAFPAFAEKLCYMEGFTKVVCEEGECCGTKCCINGHCVNDSCVGWGVIGGGVTAVVAVVVFILVMILRCTRAGNCCRTQTQTTETAAPNYARFK